MGRRNFITRRVAVPCVAVLGATCLFVWSRSSTSRLHAENRVLPSARHGVPSTLHNRSSAWDAFPPFSPSSSTAATILSAAKAQVGTVYDASYQTIPYPMGDVKSDRGACTDVVIRALRKADYDLQRLIHIDMKDARRAYPLYPHQRGLDSNIDHRRVPNQMVYFRRHGQSLPLDTKGAHLSTWQPGDVVQWNLKSNGGTLLHTGIVSDRRNARGEPFVVHNLSVCAEEDVLTSWQITGHFRFPASTTTKITRG